MADNQTCCAVHTLVEAIRDGTCGYNPYGWTLREFDAHTRNLAPGSEWPDWLDKVRGDADRIVVAHKFDFSGWPHDTTALSRVLMDTGAEMVEAGLAALPFPVVALCERQCLAGGTYEWVHLVAEHRGGVGFRSYHRTLDGARWAFTGFEATMPAGVPAADYATYWAEPPDEIPMFAGGRWRDFTDNFAGFVLSAFGALSSKGPEVRVRPAPERLNRQRAKKGKQPIFEYRIVDIPRWAREEAEAGGGTHASPRLHWRRGHVRTLPTGSKTMVRACLVGAAENGFIHKDYAVAPEVSPTDT